jgi:hypothetical protein
MRHFILISLFLVVAMVSCDLNSTTTTTSDENRVHTFAFYEDTVNPGLTEGVYKIEHSSDTGRIYSKDSLRFGTCLDSVVPYITYKATPGSATFYTPTDTIISTGSDTINLTNKPIYLQVIASDMESERWYRIDINVHQINPDLYVWTKLNESIFPKQNCETKAFYFQDQFVLYVNNGLSTQVYTSSDATTWSKSNVTPSGLPTPCQVRDIVEHHDTLYYIAHNQLYYATNYTTWTAIDYSSSTYEPINMLMSYDNKAWCIIQDRNTQQLMLATIEQGQINPCKNIIGLEDGYIPEGFPISDFAAIEFQSSSERPRAMIVGGRSYNGNPVNTRWNIEYAKNENGYRLRDFTISQPSFHTLTGASIIQYNDQLMMFGGIDNDLDWNSNILYSDDEGMNWYQPDTAYNQLPIEYESRHYQSVIVHKNSIYMIGGQSHNTSFSDVYKGCLNALLD